MPLGTDASDYAPKIRRKLTRVSLLLVVVPIALVIVAVSWLTTQALTQHEERQLGLASAYVQQTFSNRKTALLAQLQLFLGHSELAAKLALPPSKAERAVAEALSRHLGDIPELRVASATGEVLARGTLHPGWEALVERAQLGEAGVDIAWRNDTLWLQAAVPIAGPQGRGTLYAGTPLDLADLKQLKQELGHEVSFASHDTLYLSSIEGWAGNRLSLLPYRTTPVTLANHATFTLSVPLYDLLGRQVGSVLVSRHAWDLQRVIVTLLAAIVGIGLAAALVAMAFALVTTRHLASVFSQLIRGARRIGMGDLSTRIQLETDDEFEILADSFNQMTRELAASRERQLEQERMEQELKVAHHIQQSMLPSNTDEHRSGGIVLSGISLPAEHVGGDYFDQLMLEGDRLAVAMGDVNGHGISSALMMSLAKSCLHTQVLSDPGVERVMGVLNRIFFSSVKDRRFMTFLYGVVDPARMELEVASAGHHLPLLLRQGAVTELDLEPSYPLGVRYDTRYRSKGFALEAGDVLLLYTDGIVEATDGHGAEFGAERLHAALTELGDGDAITIRDGLIQAFKDFTGDRPQEDDVTLLVLKVRFGHREADA
jgi:serine phosphatase RsbU (regulator of sigma subunit)